MKVRSIVGDLINFRGLVYSPMNENGVIFIFGKVIEDLNMYIEEIKPGFPDCAGRRFTGKGWEKVDIEFEYRSSHFAEHKHDPKNCDIIVCWEHDWPECPIEVIELKEIIKNLPNKPIQRPDIMVEGEKYTLEGHLEKVPSEVKSLFERFDKELRTVSGEIWSKPTSRGVTYYSPERVFIYLDFYSKGMRLTLFTRGQGIRGVETGIWTTGGAKWGKIYIRKNRDLEAGLNASKQSYEFMREAIKANEQTGWNAELEEDQEEGESLTPSDDTG